MAKKKPQSERTSFVSANNSFEAWLAKQTTLVPRDLDLKHAKMRESPFVFLRATFFRWAERFPRVCPELCDAPAALSVGDLHVENFGTWRDAEGRFVWGINDFDEAHPLPYTSDLVRLASSVLLASGELAPVKSKRACQVVLDGYRTGLDQGQPFVLAEDHRWLLELALPNIKDGRRFWKKLQNADNRLDDVPADARALIEEVMPRDTEDVAWYSRQAGVGSLGRQRVLAIGTWKGSLVSREAKAVVQSALLWLDPQLPAKVYGDQILRQARRSPDPRLQIRPDWSVRRLDPESTKIEIDTLEDVDTILSLLESMGGELANIHVGTQEAIEPIVADLRHRKGDWLLDAARRMIEDIETDYREWCKQ